MKDIEDETQYLQTERKYLQTINPTKDWFL